MIAAWSLSTTTTVLPGAVVVVSDDVAFQEEMYRSIASAGFLCRYADDLAQARLMLSTARPDLIVVDAHTGGRNGRQLCQALRTLVDCPLLVIDRDGETIDRILALELGADDCLTSPIEAREVLARVRALVRRYDRQNTPSVRSEPVGAGWRLSLANRRLYGPDSSGSATLTSSEQELFILLVKQAGRPVVLARDPEADSGGIRTGQLRTTVSRLRRKLLTAGFDRRVIRNVHTQGYVFDSDTASAGVISA